VQHRGPSAQTYYAWFSPRHGATDTGWRRTFQKVKKELGITRKLTPHDLRRTTAVLAYQTTRDLRTVQALLGHADLAHTLYYLDHHNTPVSPALIELLRQPTGGRTQ
jgi:integrase